MHSIVQNSEVKIYVV